MGCEGTWIKKKFDFGYRGYTNQFKCSNCGSMVYTAYYMKECEYPYCPWCRCEMTETEEENDG